MLSFRSLTARMTFLHVVAILITATAIPLVLFYFMNAAVRTIHEQAMSDQAEWLASHLSRSGDGKIALEVPSGLRALFSEVYGRYAYAVLDEHGAPLVFQKSYSNGLFPAHAGQVPSGYQQAAAGHKHIAGVSIMKKVGGAAVWVQVGEDLNHRDVVLDDVVAQFLQRVGWTAIPVLLLLATADILIVRNAMQPLLRASMEAAQISPNRLALRLSVDDVPSEILPLVTSINQALDRIEEGFTRQREFIADAAHELRTPLAVLRIRLETRTDLKASDELFRDVEIMSRVIGQLLDLAESDNAHLHPEDIAELHEVCSEVALHIAPLALAQNKTVALEAAAAPVWVRGNAELLRRAVRNLAENALRHAPSGSAVELVVSPDAKVSVLDRGDGVPPAKRDTIFQRFGTQNPHRTGGAGLGLSIVKRIVQVHQGSVTVTSRPGGGSQFTLHLVAASHPPQEDSISRGPRRA